MTDEDALAPSEKIQRIFINTSSPEYLAHRDEIVRGADIIEASAKAALAYRQKLKEEREEYCWHPCHASDTD